MDKEQEKSKSKSSGQMKLGPMIFFAIGFVIFMLPMFIFGFFKPPAKTLTQQSSEVTSQGASSEEQPGSIDAAIITPYISSVVAFLGDYDRVFLRIYKDPQTITRSIRSLGGVGYKGRDAESRHDLQDFTPEIAKTHGIEFSLQSALDFTCKEVAKVVRIEVVQPIATMAVSKQHTEIEQSKEVYEAPKKSINTAISEAVGTVIQMGMTTVNVPGKTSYQTFEVSLQNSYGEPTTFAGVDLERKAAQRLFKLGDVVRIIKEKGQAMTKEKAGRKTAYSQNSYQVFVIQSA